MHPVVPENKLIFTPPHDSTFTQPVLSCVNFQPATSTNREGCWMLYGVHVNSNKMLLQQCCNLFYRILCLQAAETKTILHNKNLLMAWYEEVRSVLLNFKVPIPIFCILEPFSGNSISDPWSGFVFKVYCGVFVW